MSWQWAFVDIVAIISICMACESVLTKTWKTEEKRLEHQISINEMKQREYSYQEAMLKYNNQKQG